MAINLLNDELKSSIIKLIPPITKERIIREINGLIYHLKQYGICRISDVVKPSGSDFLASTDVDSIISSNFGSTTSASIQSLEYLYIPCEYKDIVNRINSIISIISTAGDLTSSYYYEYLKFLIYEGSPSLSGRNSLTRYNYDSAETALRAKISKLKSISLPIKSSDLINSINNIIDLYKGEARLVDANDFKLLIYSLKEETKIIDETVIDYGNILYAQLQDSNSKDDKILFYRYASEARLRIDYKNAKEINYEHQANDFASTAYLQDKNLYDLQDKDGKDLWCEIIAYK